MIEARYDLVGVRGRQSRPEKYLAGDLEATQRFQITSKNIDLLAGRRPANLESVIGIGCTLAHGEAEDQRAKNCADDAWQVELRALGL